MPEPAAVFVASRLRPEWNSACVLRGGRLIVWPGLGTTRSLPPPGLRLKDQGFVLCVSTYTCTCTCMRIIRCLLDSQGLDGGGLLTHEEAQPLEAGLMMDG